MKFSTAHLLPVACTFALTLSCGVEPLPTHASIDFLIELPSVSPAASSASFVPHLSHIIVLLSALDRANSLFTSFPHFGHFIFSILSGVIATPMVFVTCTHAVIFMGAAIAHLLWCHSCIASGFCGSLTFHPNKPFLATTFSHFSVSVTSPLPIICKIVGVGLPISAPHFEHIYGMELEYFCVKILLCSSLKRIAQINNKKIRNQLVKRTNRFIKEYFPEYRKNAYVRKEHTGLYMRCMNAVTIFAAVCVFRVRHKR